MALPTVLHSAMTGASMHVVHAWSVANSAARLALSVTAADVGKLALQTDTGRLWCLTDDSPMTWTSDYDALLTLKAPADLTVDTTSFTGTTYTLQAADFKSGGARINKWMFASNAGAKIVSVPGSALSLADCPAGASIAINREGAGTLTVDATGDASTPVTASSLTARAVNSTIVITRKTLTVWVVSGDLT
jgi:hypothetical protein